MTTPHLASASAAYRQHLIEQLQQEGAIRSTCVAQAFALIARESFVTDFYDRDNGQRTWERYTSEHMAPDAWLARIYQDTSLVTQLRGDRPTSSSSMPSIMAHMLEALEVHPGQRVLEIGTGTGYNAALLAALAGDPALITTIELDAELAARAECILQKIVGPIQVKAGNGSLGDGSSTPYDRIIATASSSTIPRAWYTQLALGGRLVMPLQGSLQSGGFLVIEKDEQSGRGLFRQPRLAFMAMRSILEEAASGTNLFQQPIASVIRVEADDPLLAALKDEQFRWFLQWWWPKAGTIHSYTMTLTDGKHAHLLKDPMQRTILQLTHRTDGCWSGKQRGAFPLWATIQQAYTLYRDLGEPGQAALQVDIDEQRALLRIAPARGGAVVSLRDLYDQETPCKASV